MREVTVKEFAAAFEGQLVEIRQEDEYGNGFSFEMSKARMEYDEMNDELSFTVGNYNTDGIGSLSIGNISENVESIMQDGDCYTISFAHNISDITVSKFKSLEELEAEHARKRADNLAKMQ